MKYDWCDVLDDNKIIGKVKYEMDTVKIIEAEMFGVTYTDPKKWKEKFGMGEYLTFDSFGKGGRNMNNPFPIHVSEETYYAGMGEYETRGSLVDNNGHIICKSDYLEQKDIDYLNDFIKEM